MQPRAADYLQPDERVLLQARRHPASVLDEVLGIVLVWAILAGAGLWLLLGSGLHLEPPAPTALWAGIAFVTLAAWSLVVFRVVRMLTSLYTVTDQRAYEAHGRLWFHVLQTTYDRITDIEVRQSPFGRALGFGTVTFQTAGLGVPLRGIRDPFAVKARVEAARTAFLRSLLDSWQPAPRRDPDGWIPVAPAGTAPGRGRETGPLRTLWVGGPTGGWLAASFLQVAPMVLFGIVVGIGAAAAEGSAWFLLAFVLVLITVQAVRSVLQYRYTRFEVTSQGVVVSSGWLGRRRAETTYEKVTDIATNQGVLGRIFGFGTIRINTAGGPQAAVVFTGVGDPEQVKAIISQARTERLGTA